MIKKFLLLLIVSCSLAGCSTKFAYNNIDWLMYWYIDDYLALERQQKALLEPEVEHWLTWHRAEQLPQYTAHLRTLKQQISDGAVSSEQWAEHVKRVKHHWSVLRDEVSPGLVALAPELSAEQINALFDALEKQNLERIAKRSIKNAHQHLEAQIEEFQDDIKQFIGRLSDKQKNLIEYHFQRFESTFADWLSYRRNIQYAARRLLLADPQQQGGQANLLDLMRHPERYQNELFRQKSAHNIQVYCELLAALSANLSRQQRQKAVNEIQSLIDDIADLIED